MRGTAVMAKVRQNTRGHPDTSGGNGKCSYGPEDERVSNRYGHYSKRVFGRNVMRSSSAYPVKRLSARDRSCPPTFFTDCIPWRMSENEESTTYGRAIRRRSLGRLSASTL